MNKIGRPPLPENQKAGSHIHLRVTKERKAAYLRASAPYSLTTWIFNLLDKAAKYKPNERKS